MYVVPLSPGTYLWSFPPQFEIVGAFPEIQFPERGIRRVLVSAVVKGYHMYMAND